MGNAGRNVTGIARDQRDAEITCNGLPRQRDVRGNNTDLATVKLTETPADVGPVDVVIFAVNNDHVAEAAAQSTPLLGDATVRPHAMGAWDGSVAPRVSAVCAVRTGAGIEVEAVDDSAHPLWTTLVSYAGASPLLAARLDSDQAAAPEIRPLVWEAAAAAAAGARAEGGW